MGAKCDYAVDMSFLENHPLILASGSPRRKQLLRDGLLLFDHRIKPKEKRNQDDWDKHRPAWDKVANLWKKYKFAQKAEPLMIRDAVALRMWEWLHWVLQPQSRSGAFEVVIELLQNSGAQIAFELLTRFEGLKVQWRTRSQDDLLHLMNNTALGAMQVGLNLPDIRMNLGQQRNQFVFAGRVQGYRSADRSFGRAFALRGCPKASAVAGSETGDANQASNCARLHRIDQDTSSFMVLDNIVVDGVSLGPTLWHTLRGGANGARHYRT